MFHHPLANIGLLANGNTITRFYEASEDTFEKTTSGWHFTSRVNVWPEIKWTGNPADMPPWRAISRRSETSGDP